VRPADRAGAGAVRRGRARLEVPGAARADSEPLLAELRARDRFVILVSGPTGFIGPKVVRALRERGQDVRCLVRDRRRARQLETWGCELVDGDMTDPASLLRAVDG